jgi:alanyl-tRNA synthetase
MKTILIKREFIKLFVSNGYKKKDSKSIIKTESGIDTIFVKNSSLYFIDEIVKRKKMVSLVSCQKWLKKKSLINGKSSSLSTVFSEVLLTISEEKYGDQLDLIFKFYDEIGIDIGKLYFLIKSEDFFELFEERGIERENIIIVETIKEDEIIIYYDRDDEFECENPDCFIGCPCDRYVRLTNIFPLKNIYKTDKKNILCIETEIEKLSLVTQGVNYIEDIDIFEPILNYFTNNCEISYGYYAEKDIPYRKIVNSVRTLVMVMIDGISKMDLITPFLDDMIIKILRSGFELGMNQPFANRLVHPTLSAMQSSYPGITENKNHILRIVEEKEEKFIFELKRKCDGLEDFYNEMDDKTQINYNLIEKMAGELKLSQKIIIEFFLERSVKIVDPVKIVETLKTEKKIVEEEIIKPIKNKNSILKLSADAATTDKLKIDFLQELFQCKKEDVLKIAMELVKRYRK